MDRRLIKFDTCAKPAQVFFMAARGSKDILTRAQNKVEHLLRDYQYPAMKEHISKLDDYFFLHLQARFLTMRSHQSLGAIGSCSAKHECPEEIEISQEPKPRRSGRGRRA